VGTDWQLPPTPDAGDEIALAEAGDADAGVTCPAAAPFRTVAEVGGVNTTTDNEAKATLTSDEKTIVFYRSGADVTGYQLYFATRDSPNDPFRTPTLVTGLPSGLTAADPALSADGNTMVFAFGPNGGTLTLYQTQFNNAGVVGTLTPLLPPDWIAVSNRPFLTSDGSELFFASVHNSDAGQDQLFQAMKLEDGVFSEPILVPGLAPSDPNAYSDTAPVLTQDELIMYFASTRPSLKGSVPWHTYQTARTSVTDSFNNPTLMGTPVNTGGDAGVSDVPDWLSVDGCRLYFESTRNGNGTADLFVASK